MKSYLNGKIKLKEPLLGDMCKVGKLIYSGYPEALVDERLLELLSIICEIDEDVDLSKLKPDISKEILKDFFTLWKPMEWIYGNLGVEKQLRKRSSSLPEASQVSGKPSTQESMIGRHIKEQN